MAHSRDAPRNRGVSRRRAPCSGYGMRKTLALAVAAAAALGGAGCFSSKACTLELRSHRVTIARDMATKFAVAGDLTVTACAGSRCETLRPDAGSATLKRLVVQGNAAPAVFTGDLLVTSGDATRISGYFQISEQDDGETSRLSVRVTDKGGAVVSDASGDVHWDGECHPEPDRTSL